MAKRRGHAGRPRTTGSGRHPRKVPPRPHGKTSKSILGEGPQPLTQQAMIAARRATVFQMVLAGKNPTEVARELPRPEAQGGGHWSVTTIWEDLQAELAARSVALNADVEAVRRLKVEQAQMAQRAMLPLMLGTARKGGQLIGREAQVKATAQYLKAVALEAKLAGALADEHAETLTLAQVGQLLAALVGGIRTELAAAVDAARFELLMRAVQQRVAQALPALTDRAAAAIPAVIDVEPEGGNQ